MSVESPIRFYRDTDGSEVILEVNNETHKTGRSDSTVSRKKESQAPIEIVPNEDHIEISNIGNSNPITIRSRGTEHTIEEGGSKVVSHDADIDIGINFEVQLLNKQ